MRNFKVYLDFPSWIKYFDDILHDLAKTKELGSCLKLIFHLSYTCAMQPDGVKLWYFKLKSEFVAMTQFLYNCRNFKSNFNIKFQSTVGNCIKVQKTKVLLEIKNLYRCKEVAKKQIVLRSKSCHWQVNVLRSKPCHWQVNVLRSKSCHWQVNVLRSK